MTKNRIKLIFVIPSLKAGGAERVMSFLAKNFNNDEFESILLVVGSDDSVSYNIDRDKTIFLEESRVKNSFFKIAKVIREERPHIIMGAISHINITLSILSIFFPSTVFIGRETLVTSKIIKSKKMFFVHSILYRIMPFLLDHVVSQSMDMKKDLIENYNFSEKKVTVINNPVTSKFQLKTTTQSQELLRFITVGRLFPQKGYLRILRALSTIKYPYIYTIIGNGPMKNEIYEFIELNNMTSNVEHLDFTKKVEKYLGKSDFFLQGSYVEGFPNALIESFAVGTPAIVFDAPGGINEIMISGINGLVAKDECEFQSFLKSIQNYRWDKIKIRESVQERYSEKQILSQYERLFRRLIDK